MNQNDFVNKYMSHLNDQQRQAVLSEASSLLILAVPGSGKTTTIVTRLGYMILVQGIRPSSILTITYTNAATRDMRDRFLSIFGEDLRKNFGSELPKFQTINSLSAGVIRVYSNAKGSEPFELVDESDRSLLIRDILLRSNGGFPTDADIQDFKLKLSLIKNMMYADDEIKAIFKPEGDAVLEQYKQYEAALRENRLMDFDDQMVYARRILLQRKDILQKYRERYQYICVDEAQDTSKIQHEIIRILVGNSGRLLMVGDEDQSIYGFRGAYPDALLSFKRTYRDAKVMPIEYNYRSLSEIVSLADRFIAKNTNRTKKNMKATRFAVTSSELDNSFDNSSGDTDNMDTVINLLSVAGRNSQYEPIMNLLSSGNLNGTTAILYRNNESSIPIINFLDREGIAYKVKQFDPTFFTHRIVADICNTIRFAYNPNDRELFMDLYYKFGLKVSKIEAASAVEKSIMRDCSPIEILATEVSQYKKGDVLSFQRGLNKLMKDRAADAIDRIVNEMGYREFMNDLHLDSSKADILKLIGLTEDSPLDLLERLEELKLIISSENRDDNDEAYTGVKGYEADEFNSFYEDDDVGFDELNENPVILSTIHSSKGLEYDNVIIVDAAEGILPSIAKKDAKTDEDKRQYEEERRLYYVALTRAKNRLFIFAYRNQLSEFVREQFAAEIARKTARVHTSYSGARANTVNGGAIEESSFEVGMRVEHSKFGKGTIENISDGIISVRFDNQSLKKLGMSFVLDGHLLDIL